MAGAAARVGRSAATGGFLSIVAGGGTGSSGAGVEDEGLVEVVATAAASSVLGEGFFGLFALSFPLYAGGLIKYIQPSSTNGNCATNKVNALPYELLQV